MAVKWALGGLVAAAALTGVAPAQDGEQVHNEILGFYGSLAMVGAVTEYCFDNDGYQPLYMSAGEGWRIRNLPHLDLADAAAAKLGGIGADERAQTEAAAISTMMDAARANADIGAYCSNLAQVLESGALDLDVYFPQEYERIRAAAGG